MPKAALCFMPAPDCESAFQPRAAIDSALERTWMSEAFKSRSSVIIKSPFNPRIVSSFNGQPKSTINEEKRQAEVRISIDDCRLTGYPGWYIISGKMKLELDEIRSRILAHLEADENVQFALAFGSRISGRPGKRSDLDLAVYFNRPPGGLEFLEKVSRLSDAAGLEVDLVALNSASAFLRHQVMKTGALLISKNDLLLRRFRERTIMDYDEYRYVARMGTL